MVRVSTNRRPARRESTDMPKRGFRSEPSDRDRWALAADARWTQMHARRRVSTHQGFATQKYLFQYNEDGVNSSYSTCGTFHLDPLCNLLRAIRPQRRNKDLVSMSAAQRSIPCSSCVTIDSRPCLCRRLFTDLHSRIRMFGHLNSEEAFKLNILSV